MRCINADAGSKADGIAITGIGNATDSIQLAQRDDMLRMDAVVFATQRALEMAKKTGNKLDYDFVPFNEEYSYFEQI